MSTETLSSIDKYQIVRELGRGATSAVYLAYDTFLARQVAIKVFRSEALLDATHGRYFQRLMTTEASLVGRLNHPHIVGIYDAVTGRDVNYIVMEYVEGQTLECCCQPETLLTIPRVAEIVFKCALALDSAHRSGVVHRDIKPANIMLCRDGDIKIADFGAAVLTRGDETQMLGVGSPLYMSPEQIRHETLNQQTDVYSLGVVMYRMLTGRLPYEADNDVALSLKILHDAPTPLRYLRPSIPPRIEEIVGRAMARDLATRYASGREFASELSHIAAMDIPEDAISELEKFETVRGLSFFAEFSDIEVWEVLRLSTWDRAAAGAVLLREGDAGSFFFIVADGEVAVSKGARSFGSQGQGACFGEMCYIRGGAQARIATVTATTRVTLLRIAAESLRNASDACQLKFNRAFLNTLVDRLARTDAELAGCNL